MQILHTINPTLNQKKVLAIIASNKDHPAMGLQKLTASPNLIAARNLLMKLNVITVSSDAANLTDRGEQLAKDYNIIDDSGGLTDEGQKLINNGDDQQEPSPSLDTGMDASMGMDTGMGDTSSSIPNTPPTPIPGMESFSPLFKKMIL